MKIIMVISSLVVLMLAACGGGGVEPSALDSLLAQAEAKQTEARALAVDTPCSNDSQCSVLFFGDTKPGCTTGLTEKDYKIYSLVSATATQASAATDQYNVIASQALNLQEPRPGTYACPAVVINWPTTVCVANKCQATP